jgi:hypothetical protein
MARRKRHATRYADLPYSEWPEEAKERVRANNRASYQRHKDEPAFKAARKEYRQWYYRLHRTEAIRYARDYYRAHKATEAPRRLRYNRAYRRKKREERAAEEQAIMREMAVIEADAVRTFLPRSDTVRVPRNLPAPLAPREQAVITVKARIAEGRDIGPAPKPQNRTYSGWQGAKKRGKADDLRAQLRARHLGHKDTDETAV